MKNMPGCIATSTSRSDRRVLLSSTAASLALLAFFVASGATPLPVDLDTSPKVLVLDTLRVYFPGRIAKDSSFTKPATVETHTVFGSIREWLEIKRKKLSEKDAEYHLLLKAANDRFAKAVKDVQRDKEYDIIAEKGAIKCVNCKSTDATTETVESLTAE